MSHHLQNNEEQSGMSEHLLFPYHDISEMCPTFFLLLTQMRVEITHLPFGENN